MHYLHSYTVYEISTSQYYISHTQMHPAFECHICLDGDCLLRRPRRMISPVSGYWKSYFRENYVVVLGREYKGRSRRDVDIEVKWSEARNRRYPNFVLPRLRLRYR
jgi:hypothetical protein